MAQEATPKHLSSAPSQTLFARLASLCFAAICHIDNCVLSARPAQATPPAIAQA
jgi:hypothetical protein